jgi:cytidylate kinase
MTDSNEPLYSKTSNTSPIICIDGPAGVGKGTVAIALAKTLGWHILDSGSLYRIVGLSAHRQNIAFDHIDELVAMTKQLDIRFTADNDKLYVFVNDQDYTTDIRTEICGNYASQIAIHQPIRDALVDLQHSFSRPPGLIADGRDMGTIIFPTAACKLFLDASVEIRADRRYKQLKEKGIDANLRALLVEIKDRDDRDRNRKVAPLVPADDAYIVDTSDLSISEVLAKAATYISTRYPELAKDLSNF